MKVEHVAVCRSWYRERLAAIKTEEMSLFCKHEAPLIDLLAWDLKVLVFHARCNILKRRLYHFCNGNSDITRKLIA